MTTFIDDGAIYSFRDDGDGSDHSSLHYRASGSSPQMTVPFSPEAAVMAGFLLIQRYAPHLLKSPFTMPQRPAAEVIAMPVRTVPVGNGITRRFS